MNDKQEKLRSVGKVCGGTTLVELVLYVAIFVTMIGGISAFTAMMQSGKSHSQILFEVQDQGAAISREIVRVIRNADSVSAPAQGATSTSITLGVASTTLNPTAVYASGGTLYETNGSAPAVALSNGRIVVSGLTFENVSKPGTPGTVMFRFTLSNVSSATRSGQQYTSTFYGSASIRK